MLAKCCNKCKAEKPIEEFSINRESNDGYAWSCKNCLKNYRTNRPKEILDRYNNISKAYKRKYDSLDSTKNRNKLHSEKQKYKKFGITKNIFDNLCSNQKGCCAICECPANSEKSLAIDHNHETGKVRGLLCAKCNVGLGMFKDNKNLLANAINYLSLNS